MDTRPDDEGARPGAPDKGPGHGAAWPTAILHLDMDAFFVNVYLLENQEERGLPLAVGGRPDARGVVTSASYEARRFGVRSGMPMRTAVRLCPRLRVVGANWSRIRECSREVMELLAAFGPIEPVSIDEAFVDLSHHAAPHDVAVVVRERVRSGTGLPASAGLSTSKLVSKVASEQAKPDGCRVVYPGEEEGFLAPLPARALWGIGPRTAEWLAELGIETCADLASADADDLGRRMGAHARALPARARGLDGRKVRSGRHRPKSISTERTFDRDLAEGDALIEHLRELSTKVGSRLRRHELVCSRVFVKFRWWDFTTLVRQRALSVPIDADEDIFRHAASIWIRHWPPGRKVRLMGVGVGDLDSTPTRQLRLGLD